MLWESRKTRAARQKREQTRRAFHAAVNQLRRNEAAFDEVRDSFDIERSVYEHAALLCRCRALLRRLRGNSPCPRR